MKKLIIACLILSAFFVYSAKAQIAYQPVLYLELEQTGLPELDPVGVSIRVRVTSAEEANTLKTELANRFFSGLSFASKLHVHRTDGPCEAQDL